MSSDKRIVVKSATVTVKVSGFSLTVKAVWSATGVVLPGVSLQAAGTTATTGTDGIAVFKNLGPGYYTVFGNLAGYDQGHVSVQLSGDQTATLQMVRSAQTYVLEISASANPASPATGQNTTFSASGAGGSGQYLFTWTFDDGSILEGASVVHAFGTVGTHATQVEMTDLSNGQQLTTNVNVSVVQGNPRLSLVTVTVTSSFDNSPWPGATAVLGNLPPLQTNNSGQAVFEVQPGTYNLSVSTPGAVPYSTMLNVSGDMQIPVVLTLTMI